MRVTHNADSFVSPIFTSVFVIFGSLVFTFISDISVAEEKDDFCDSRFLAIEMASSLKDEGSELNSGILGFRCEHRLTDLMVASSSVEIGGFYGTGVDYNLALVGLSQGLLFKLSDKFYSSLSIGGYIKSKRTERISSIFTFGERVSLGYSPSEEVGFELFLRHFSNAGITERNSGQNFAGVSVSFGF